MKTSLYAGLTALTLAACAGPQETHSDRRYTIVPPTRTQQDTTRAAAERAPKLTYEGTIIVNVGQTMQAQLYRIGDGVRGSGGVDSLVLNTTQGTKHTFYTNSDNQNITLDSTAGSDVLDSYTRINGNDTLRVAAGKISINDRVLDPEDVVDGAVLRQPEMATTINNATNLYNGSMRSIVRALAQRFRTQ